LATAMAPSPQPTGSIVDGSGGEPEMLAPPSHVNRLSAARHDRGRAECETGKLYVIAGLKNAFKRKGGPAIQRGNAQGGRKRQPQ
jgi:hypothetical protein